MTISLTPTEQAQIETLARRSPSPAVQRRAQLVLLYAEGLPTRQAAARAGLSRGRARYWRHHFELLGMAIFPPAELDRLTAETPERPAPDQSAAPESGDGRTPDEPAPLPPLAAVTVYTPVAVPAPVPPTAHAELLALLELPRPGVLPGDPLAEAGRKVLRYHFAEMLRHEPGTRLGEDIEELHDMRVATRRMRAAFEVFGAAFKRKVFKKHLNGLRAAGRLLGRVRDLDVFMEKAGHYLQSLPEEQRSGLDPLLHEWKGEREQARAAMLEHLNSNTYQSFVPRFADFLLAPGAGSRQVDAPEPSQVRHVVPVLVYTRLASVRAFDQLLASATLEQLHALRIQFKQLRYTLEFFREVLGAEAKDIINELKDLQDHLGDLNDANVACQLLRDFLEQMDLRQQALPIGERFNPEPVVAYLGYRHAERHRLMLSFQPAWEHFERPEMRRMIARAVEEL